MPTARELLQVISAHYIPSNPLALEVLEDRPLFNLRMIPEMLYDPRITFGLWMIKGPIMANSQFFVECEVPVVKDFLVKNITRFWRNSTARALTAIEWGFSGHEVLYRVEDNKLQFDILKSFNQLDVKPTTIAGKINGLWLSGRGTDKGTFIGGGKAFWHTHAREFNPWFGRSRFFSAYIPWLEKWTNGGFRDVRRLWWHKYAYEGGILYHPQGEARLEGESVLNYKDMARRIMDAAKAGGTKVFPNTVKDGMRVWDYKGPDSPGVPTGLEQYGESLSEEILEALGIPPEVAKAVGTGAFAGRRIPQQAFFAILQELVIMLMSDADQQIFRPLVEFNFGKVPYQVIPFGLLKKPGERGQPDQPEPSEEEEGAEMGLHIHGLMVPNRGVIAA